MINLTYVHGSENHFYLLDFDNLVEPLSQKQLANLAIQLANNDTLPVSDGLLVVSKSDHDHCIGKMQVFNSDGSIASMCGNGLRCVSRYLAEKYHRIDFLVETMQADLTASIFDEQFAGVSWVGVQIAPVLFGPQDLNYTNLDFSKIINQFIPQFSDHLKFTAIAVPNPHLISFVDDDAELEEPLLNLGTHLNQPNDYFPDGVNVSFAKILGKNKLFVRTFERGVGFTNACGTGMSATSMSFALNYPESVNTEEIIDVYNPGGMVQTKVNIVDGKPDSIQLMGNATFVGTVSVTLDDQDHIKNISEFKETDEESNYLAFIDQIKK